MAASLPVWNDLLQMVGEQLSSYIHSRKCTEIHKIFSVSMTLYNDFSIMSSSPADSFFHLSSPAIRNDVCEGEATVHNNATQLRVFLMEVSMSTQRSSWKTKLHLQIYGILVHNLSRLHPSTLYLPLILRADWNWYSSNKISFMDSWIEVKLKYGSVITMLVSAKSTCKYIV